MTSLQGLDQIIVRKECGNELYQLENLNQLRGKMCIRGLENVGSTTDAVKAKMRNKKNLKTINFEWNSNERYTNNVTDLSTQHVQLLDALEPHPNIGALTIKGFEGDRFPNWLVTKNSLKHLTLLILKECNKVEIISFIEESLPNCKSLVLKGLINLKKMPSLPSNLTYLVIDNIPQLAYLSEDDLLMKEEIKQFTLEATTQITEYLKLAYVRLPKNFEVTMWSFIRFVKQRLEAAPEISITSSQYENICSEMVKLDLLHTYSRVQLLDAWVVFMNYHIETMFNKKEESKMILPSSLHSLEISSCSITDDAFATCIQSLVSLFKLKLSDIQTITSLPPKEYLSSLKKLLFLSIEDCYLLYSLGGIGALTSLINLKLIGCPSLKTSNEPLPSSLEILQFYDCSNLDVANVTCINGRGLQVGDLSCLKELHIVGCDGRLESLNSSNSLDSLRVAHCPDTIPSSPMDKYASALNRPGLFVDSLLQLKSIILSNKSMSSIDLLCICFFKGDSLDDDVFQTLISLKALSFYECNIIHLPKNLKNHTSLRCIYIVNCPNLCDLEELPRNLRRLDIQDCPTLTEKFNKDGPYQVWIDEGITTVIFPMEEEGTRC